MSDTQKGFTYDERVALQTLRKSIGDGRTHVLDALFAELSKATISSALVAAKIELENNLRAVRALQQAAQSLIDTKKD